MVRHSFVKPVSAIGLAALLACSGGGSTQSNPPTVGVPNTAQVAGDPPGTTASARTTAGVSTFATTIQTCALTSPCISGTNTSSGAGVAGISTNGRGVSGTTKHNSTAARNAMFGVYGQDSSTSGTYDGGVFGTSVRGYGVYGQSTSGYGMRAFSSSSIGIFSQSTSGDGLYGFSNNSVGTVGVSNAYIGVYASGVNYGVYSFGSGTGVFGSSSSGTAVSASSSTGFGVQSHTGGHVAVYATNSNGNGADVTGTYIGLVARATSFPIVATDPNGNNLFYVDGSGNVFYHGSISHFARVLGGGSATAYSPGSTRPSIEDTGTAHLVSGRATVPLDPTFARAIDRGRAYQVFLTPGGDTRGLYVASKGASAFVVREVQGGRGTFDFDYHIYATALGAAGQHMAIAQPNAPVIHRSAPAVVQPPQIPHPEQ